MLKFLSKEKLYFLLLLSVIILLPGLSFSQHPENIYKSRKVEGDLNVDSLPDSLDRHTAIDTSILDATQPGYYRIFLKCLYSGESQANEHVFMTVSGNDSVRTPFDKNLGLLKIVEDSLALPDTIWRDMGLFYFSSDTNVAVFHHYNSLFKDSSYFYLVDGVSEAELMKIVDGDTIGIKQSVHVDSIIITAQPIFSNANDVIKTDTFIDNDNNGTLSNGDVIEYTIRVVNSGSGVAHHVVFSDSIPENTTYVDGSATTTKGVITSTSPVLNIDIGTIDSDRAEIITIRYRVMVNTDAQRIRNQGYVNSDETDPEPTDDPETEEPNDPTYTDVVDFNGAADFLKRDTFTDQDGDGLITPGDLIDYSITIKNSGGLIATNVVFTDTIPSHTSLVENSITTTKGTITRTSPIIMIQIGDVAPQEIETVTITFQVMVEDTVSRISNQAFIDGDNTVVHPSDDPDTDDEDDPTHTDFPSFLGETDVLKRDVFIDADMNGSLTPGDTIAYFITIQNSGVGLARNVVFTDTIPNKTQYVDGTLTTTKGSIVSTAPVLQVNIGTIEPNASEVIAINFKVLVTDSTTIVRNQGYVDSDETDPHPTNDPDTPEDDDDTITNPRMPDFEGNEDVIKNDQFYDNDNDGLLSPGDVIAYTIRISNSGTAAANQVVFADTIPENTTYVEGSATTSKGVITSTSPVLEVEIGTIDTAQSEIITIAFQVRIENNVTQIRNQGYVDSDETDPHPSDDPETEDPDDPTYTRFPNFGGATDLLKRDTFHDEDNDGLITPGDLIDYTIAIKNSGGATAKNVAFTDTIPAHTSLVENSISTTKGTITSTTPVINIQIGDVLPEELETVTITFQVRVVDSVSRIENQGFIDGDNIEEYPTDDPDSDDEDDKTVTEFPRFSGETDVTKRDVFIDADRSGTLTPGDTIAYFISIKNSGAGVAHNVVLTDTIPAQTSYVEGSLTTTKGSIVSTTPVLQVNIGSIAPNGTETVAINFDVLVTDSTQSVRNKGYVESDETDKHPTNDPDTPENDDDTITDPKPPNFSGKDDVTKNDDFYDVNGDGSISPGDVISYTISITNSGVGMANNVVFTDTIPQFTSYIAGTGTTSKGQIVATSPVFTVNIGTIQADNAETVTINFDVMVTQAAEQIENQGLVSCNEIVPEPTDDPETEEENDKTITKAPSFFAEPDFVKSAKVKDVDKNKKLSPGDIISYTITIQNSGTGIAHNVVFADTIPQFTEYKDGSATTTKGSFTSTTPVLIADIGDVAPNKAEIVTIFFQVTITENVTLISNQAFIKSDESPDEPSDDPETEEENDKTIIDNSVFYTDISVYQYAETDSFHFDGGDTTKFVHEEETYTVNIRVDNFSDETAINVKVFNIVPDSVEISNVFPSGYSFVGDTIFWDFDSLEIQSTFSLKFDATVPFIMPEGITGLINTVIVSCDNEDSTKYFDNTAIDTVFSVVEPFLYPLIEAMPERVDVTDSIAVKIQIPKYKSSWDLWVYLPDGSIQKGFGDDFFQNTTITPDVWYDITESYKPDTLISSQRQDELVFEIRTLDNKGREANAQTSVIVYSGNYLVLDRNVFKPELEDALGIKFKLSYRRVAKLDVYDLTGKHITKVAEDIFHGGWNTYYWNGMSSNGQRVGSGVYIVTLRSGEFNSWKKFIIVR